jgi:hypothetical protein
MGWIALKAGDPQLAAKTVPQKNLFFIKMLVY